MNKERVAGGLSENERLGGLGSVLEGLPELKHAITDALDLIQSHADGIYNSVPADSTSLNVPIGSRSSMQDCSPIERQFKSGLEAFATDRSGGPTNLRPPNLSTGSRRRSNGSSLLRTRDNSPREQYPKLAMEIDLASSRSVDLVKDTPSDLYNGPRNDELLEALSAVSASSGTSGITNTSLWPSDFVSQSQKMVFWILDRLGQMSVLSRDLAFERRFAELANYPEVFSDGLARHIYPHSKEVVRKLLPDAISGLQIRISAAICLGVKELIQAKDQYQHHLDGPYHPRDEDLGDSGDHEQVLIRGVKRRGVKQSDLSGSVVESLVVEDITMVDIPHDEKSPTLEDIELVDSSQLTDETPTHTADDQPNFYVCIVLECEAANKLYKSQSEWLEHTEGTHAQHRTWICTAICHGNDSPLFHSVVRFQNHMWDKHRGSFSASDLSYLTESCERPACSTNIFFNCPLCKERVPEGLSSDDRPLLDHLVQHFANLSKSFLQILPSFEDIIDPPGPMQQWENGLYKKRRKDEGERNIWLHTQLSQLPEASRG